MASFQQWAAVDIALYKHFYQKLTDRLEKQTDDFFEEVESFRAVRGMVAAYCTASQNASPVHDRYFAATNHTSEFVLRRTDCELMLLDESNITTRARVAQQLRVEKYNKERRLTNTTIPVVGTKGCFETSVPPSPEELRLCMQKLRSKDDTHIGFSTSKTKSTPSQETII